jgi:hypothetical protein
MDCKSPEDGRNTDAPEACFFMGRYELFKLIYLVEVKVKLL